MWEKSTAGQTMQLVSPSDTLFFIPSSLVCPASSGVLADLMGEFLVEFRYSESSLLSPKMATNLMSLSGSAGGLSDVF